MGRGGTDARVNRNWVFAKRTREILQQVNRTRPHTRKAGMARKDITFKGGELGKAGCGEGKTSGQLLAIREAGGGKRPMTGPTSGRLHGAGNRRLSLSEKRGAAARARAARRKGKRSERQRRPDFDDTEENSSSARRRWPRAKAVVQSRLHGGRWPPKRSARQTGSPRARRHARNVPDIFPRTGMKSGAVLTSMSVEGGFFSSRK